MPLALQQHFQGVHPNRRFAVPPLENDATSVYVRQPGILLTPKLNLRNNFIGTPIGWFNLQQPAQRRMRVPHLSWPHTIAARPAGRRPPPVTAGRDSAAPQLSLTPSTSHHTQ